MPPVFKKTITLIVLFFTLVPAKHLIAAPPVQDSIIGLYTAYYNRAPDQGGFDFWNQQASATGDISATLLMISEGFSQHPQFIQDYPRTDSTRQFVTKIYNNILNRAPDAGGLDFWVKELDRGLRKSKFIVTYLNNVLTYSGTDPEGIKSKQMFSNKVTVGQCFIDALGTASNGEPGSIGYNRSVYVLSGVTEEHTSMELAVNKIKGYLPSNAELPSSCLQGITESTADDIDIIVINNSKLQACLNEQLGHTPSQSELQTLQAFSCRGKGLTNSDIVELSQLTQLTRLNLGNNIFNYESDSKLNQISDLNPLSSLTQLTTLYIINNQISDVTPLGSLTQLTDLSLSFNQISDVTPLSSLSQLINLDINNNQISNVTPLAPLNQLYILSLGNNQISDISPLNSLTQLTELGIGNNQVSDVNPLSTLTQLTILALSQNQISDVTQLISLTRLTMLDIQNNQISDIASLSSLTHLTHLYIQNNQISDIAPLSSLTHLIRLLIHDNKIRDVSPLSSLTQLTSLYIQDNQISDITPLSSLLGLNNPNQGFQGLQLGGNCIINFNPISHLNGVVGKNSQKSSCYVEAPAPTPVDSITDPFSLGDNVTASLGKNPRNGYDVYTLDLAKGGITAIPSCANGLNILHECEGRASWNKGAKTTEVYAVRAEKKHGRSEEISIAPLAFGVGVTGTFFDFTVSGNPGDIDASTFVGGGCIKKVRLVNYDINLITDAQFNKFKSQLPLLDACYVPEGSQYYINIRATDAYCDHAGELREDGTRIGLCNSYFEIH